MPRRRRWDPRFVLALLVLGGQNIAQLLSLCQAERAYPQGCSQFEASYSDYEHLEWPPPFCQPLLSANDYWLTRRLGTGKFSDVFEAIQHSTAQHQQENPPDDDASQKWVVLKCLKPVAERKVRRELLVLHRCATLVHLARLEGLVLQKSESSDSDSAAATTTVTLVLQHAGREAQWFCHPVSCSGGGSSTSSSATLPQPDEHQLYLSDYEIRYFLGHLLLALDDLHRAGIMHRDTKPRNVLINRSVAAAAMPAQSSSNSSTAQDTAQAPTPLTLIDLGLADFYHPGCPYNVRVASRHYKAPELLVGWEYYNSAVDLWGVGCILAGLLLRREPLFRGRDNLDQLGKIVRVLGVTRLQQFVRRHRILLAPEVEREIWQREDPDSTERLSLSPRMALLALAAAPSSSNHRPPTTTITSMDDPSSTTTASGDFHIPADGLDLVEHLLVYDPEERWTARQAWQHPYFDIVRERVENEVDAARQKLWMPP